jgi:bifunctional DNA-binding transcriptional regulator/antitoxin component of YhaV-PrlF toxin-antitoxin module
VKQGPPYTVTVSSQGQLSVPVAVSRRLGLQPGAKVDIYPIGRGALRATVRRPSRILEYAGDLKDWDKNGARE